MPMTDAEVRKLRYQIRKQGFEPLLGPEDTFKFACPPSCWGTCCRNITIRLSPYDVYRLGKALGKSMTQTIQDHGRFHVGKDSRWPIVTLASTDDGACEFLAPDGRCTMREGRPSVCRSSPLGRMKAFQNGEQQQVYILTYPHPMCQKKNSPPPVTAKDFELNPQAAAARMLMQQQQPPAEPAKRWTVAEFLEEGEVETWWRGSDSYMDLLAWAHEHLSYEKWANDQTAHLIGNFLFGCDQMVPPETSEDEMFRRSIEATKWYLTYIAAGYGYGALDTPKNPIFAVAGVQIIFNSGLHPTQEQLLAEQESFYQQLENKPELQAELADILAVEGEQE